MADRRQLLYALTLPEYLEAWVTPADASSAHERAAMRSGTAYAIRYFDVHRQPVIIEGLFHAATRDKVAFTWRRSGAPRQSMVTIRLSGNFAFTTLMLTHTGVRDEIEYCWLRDFWGRSLIRLKSLIEGGRSCECDVQYGPLN